MRLDLTDDQQLLQETLRRFVEAETPIGTVRERIDADDVFDPRWWKSATELGATSFLVPESAGGGSVSGRGPADLVIVAEEFGRGVVPNPLLPCNVVAETLGRRGTGGQLELLGEVLSGDAVVAWAGDPGVRPDAPLPIRAVPATDGFALSGTAVAVEAVDQAGHLLVTAQATDGPVQFLIPRDTAGVTVHPQESLDLLRRFGRVEFDGAFVRSDQSVGSAATAPDDIRRQRLVAMLIQCAESCGATARVLEFTIEWAFDRYSFGRPLASYQALKHRFADMKLWIEAAHAITDDAAAAMSTDGDPSGLVHAAKAYVGDRSVDIIQDCVQLHGGIGVTWEHDIHLYLRRVTVNRGLFGDPTAHRMALAEQLGM